MAAKVTQGRRITGDDITDSSVANMAPGDYLKRGDSWYAYAPREGAGPSNISTWEITEHEDGTITVSPSIHVKGKGGWHGFLVNGVWNGEDTEE